MFYILNCISLSKMTRRKALCENDFLSGKHSKFEIKISFLRTTPHFFKEIELCRLEIGKHCESLISTILRWILASLLEAAGGLKKIGNRLDRTRLKFYTGISRFYLPTWSVSLNRWVGQSNVLMFFKKSKNKILILTAFV